MKKCCLSAVLALSLASCSFYNPLKNEPDLYHGPIQAPSGAGVKVTFLGNTTLHITDGTTDLLVDGFLTRPGAIKTFVFKIASDKDTVGRQLDKAHITKVDAVLVGHAHHDHALDAPMISLLKNSLVMGNKSYAMIQEGAKAPTDKAHLFTVPCDGTQKKFGDFTVTFVKSKHVTAHWRVQKKLEGEIDAKLETPARFTKFKDGQVYAIHIAHPEGSILVTTTAGAEPGKLQGYHADVAFLGIGLLGKETVGKQNTYWKQTVEAVHAPTVVPVHWDSFVRSLDRGLKSAAWPFDNVRADMNAIKSRASSQKILLMGLRDSLLLQHGKILTQPAEAR